MHRAESRRQREKEEQRRLDDCGLEAAHCAPCGPSRARACAAMAAARVPTLCADAGHNYYPYAARLITAPADTSRPVADNIYRPPVTEASRRRRQWNGCQPRSSFMAARQTLRRTLRGWYSRRCSLPLSSCRCVAAARCSLPPPQHRYRRTAAVIADEPLCVMRCTTRSTHEHGC